MRERDRDRQKDRERGEREKGERDEIERSSCRILLNAGSPGSDTDLARSPSELYCSSQLVFLTEH